MLRAPTFAAVVFPLACLAGSCAPSMPPAPSTAPASSAPVAAAAPAERLAADTRESTSQGNTFMAPAGWSLSTRGPATILEPPEGNSAIALVDVRAPSADSAVAAAWRAYKPDARWPVKVVNDKPDKDGWSDIRNYEYQTSPNEKRDVGAQAQRAGDVWTVAIYDMEQAVGREARRSGQPDLRRAPAEGVYPRVVRRAGRHTGSTTRGSPS